MNGLNKSELIGNVGQDPELRYTSDGKAVVNFSIATNESWRTASGDLRTHTEWHQCEVWGKAALNFAKYVKKGRQIFLSGRLRTSKWTNKDGQQVKTTKIVCDDVKFLGRGEERVESGAAASGGYSSDAGPFTPDPDEGQYDDDIPL